MAELVISIVAPVVSKIGELLVKPTIRAGRYLFCGAKITKKFEYAKEELMKTQNEVQKRVEELPKAEIADGAVVKWLDDVKNLITEVEKLEEEIKAKGSCFRWCCLYGLYKQMAQKTETLIELNGNNKFAPFSNPAPLPDIDYHSSGNFMKFKSTKLAMDQLLEALGDGSSCVIGLYGMGGSGKTTLAIEVGKEAKKSKLFDRVVLTTVSQAPNVKRIQEEIGGFLDVEFKNDDSEAIRARKISRRLQSKERILVILDDVWGKLNLEEIGASVDGNHNSFKVLLTTRSSEVCSSMGCQKKIPLELLSEDEAWTLFKKRADLDDEHMKLLKGKAQEVARECKGLHIAIDAVGTSLKGKPIDHWVVALNRLQSSEPVDVLDGVRDAFPCLKLSYDYLRSEEAKLLFLMCSMFPEDHNISVEDLFRYGIGLGVHREGVRKEVKSYEIARSEVKKDIDYLIESCLLMQSMDEKDHVKMHDMVRDVALWIASKEDHTIIVNHPEGLNSLTETVSAQNCFAITSWHKEIAQFPEQLDAPKLEILLLSLESHMNLSYASFEGIKGLKLLGIINNNYYKSVMVTLPQSIQWLTNLCLLQLIESELGDISFVTSLKTLEILDLKFSKFKGLPCGLEELKKLKLLDLTECQSNENCYEVLRRCSQLKELYVDPGQLDLQLEELYVAPDWLHFQSNIMDSEAFYMENVTFPKLQRYILKVGHCYQDVKFISSSQRALYIGDLNISTSGATIKNLIQRATEVFLERLGGCKSVIPEMVEAIGGMSELIGLCLVSCSEIECLFSTTFSKAKSFEEDIALSNLVRLTLFEMNNLIELCRGPSLLCIFQNLEDVNISNCNQLRSLFPGECNLQNLKYLSIKGCPKLKYVFSAAIRTSLPLLIRLSISNCEELEKIIAENEDPQNLSNAQACFPKLEVLSVEECDKLKILTSTTMAIVLPQLEYLKISNCAQLEEIFRCEHIEDSSINNRKEFMLPNLTYIILEQLPRLVDICQGFTLHVGKLNDVTIVECPKFTPILGASSIQQSQEALTDGHVSSEIYAVQAILKVKMQFPANEGHRSIMVSNLNKLNLRGLPELVFIWKGPTLVSFQLLRDLNVEGCIKLRSIFSVAVIRSLPLLETLEIKNCEELEEIISVGEGEEPHLPNSSNSGPQQPCFPKLDRVEVEGCNKLKCVFPAAIIRSLPLLEELCIKNCEELEEIISAREGEEPHLPKSSNSGPQQPCFPKLDRVEVEGCNKLKCVFPAAVIRSLPLLERLCINHCEELEEIISVGEAEEPHLPNSSNSGPQQSYFPKLYHVEVQGCNKLKCVFPAAAFRSLPLLEWLYIKNCEELVEIISVGEGEEPHLPNSSNSGPQQPCFPKLDCVIVEGCNKLKCVFPAAVFRSLPLLKMLCIKHCEELEEIISVGEGEEPHLPNSSNSGPQQSYFPKLDRVEVEGCNKLKCVFPAAVIRSLPLLEWLYIKNCEELEQIISVGEGEEPHLPNSSNSGPQQLCFAKLDRVEVEGCNKLKCIFPTAVIRSLPFLEWLCIKNCEELEEIISVGEGEEPHLPNSSNSGPQQLCFPKLDRVEVEGCNKLKCVFPAAVIRSLPLLKNLEIKNCEKLEEIISVREGEEPHLPNSSNSGLQQPCFPKLDRVEVEGCNKLKCVFPAIVIRSLPLLETLEIKNCEELEEIISVGEGEEPHLPNSSNSGPQQPCFPKLDRVEVEGCNKLKCVFPVAVIRSLPLLEELCIKNCEELEEIISAGEGEEPHLPNSSNSGPQQPCFPMLDRVEVEGCNKLKCVFPVSISGDLPCLRGLDITRCSQLEQVFGCVPENHDEEMMELALQNLKWLALKELPSLTNICRCFESRLQLKALRNCRVNDCPNFHSTTVPALHKVMTQMIREEENEEVEEEEDEEEEAEEEDDEEDDDDEEEDNIDDN